ncbi:MAG: LPS-assembly protein LptD [Candidatus Omnitrophica bacterium]|nr:LPS-assembly protein LptD [Candidatus Omnitrophota bacterium]
MGFSLLVPLLHPSDVLAATNEPVSVRGDQVEYFDALHKIVASGNVVASYKDTKLSCDQATIYTVTKDAYLKGRVRLVQPQGLLKGKEVIYNFGTRKGVVLEAEVEAGPWRTVGDEAQKVSGTAVQLKSGTVTTCDFEEPHSRLQAKEIQIFLDDKIVLKHAVMFIGNLPVFYLPSYIYPLDDKRPRVAIIPGKSKPWGLFLLTTWRLYLTENLQGQVHLDYRERKGFASGEDLKYELPTEFPVGGEGLLRTYYTNQRDIQRKQIWVNWFKEKKPSPPEVDHERFRVQLRHRTEIDPETRASLEYNVMKDPTVVQDFFPLEAQNDPSPATYFSIVRGAPWYGLTFLVNKRVNKFETLTQEWPSLSFNLRPQFIPWLPAWERWGKWYYQSSFDYSHTNVAQPLGNGLKESVVKGDTTQELFYPTRLLRWLNVRPFFKFRETAFSRGANQTKPLFRQAAESGFDLNTRFFRTFATESNFLGLDLHKLRHIIAPALTYDYQAPPTLSADRFLRSDGLAKSNKLTPSIEQKLQTKRGEQGSLQTVDLARFTTSSSYDLEGSSGRGGRWGDVALDLESKLYRWLYFESDAKIDPHRFWGKPVTLNADFIASPQANGRLPGARIGEVFDDSSGQSRELPWAFGMGYRYQREVSSVVTLQTVLNLGPKWRLGMYQGIDVKRFVTETSDRGNRVVKKIYDFPDQEFRLRRDLHEWTAELVYQVQRGQGEAILLLFRLKAFPDLPLDFERGYHRPKAGKNFAKPGEIRD